MAKVYIDGQEGTTGLQIRERLLARDDIKLLEIDPSLRKDFLERAKLINDTDVVILCLPDAAAIEAVSLVKNGSTRVIDASTAHRVNRDWIYGLPELVKGQREKIRSAMRVANPGCYPTGYLLLVRPLFESGLISQNAKLSCHALSGYSGAGKKLISVYENPARSPELMAPKYYALSLKHKHLPEMAAMSGLVSPPIFSPSVGPYYNGMVVSVPLLNSCLEKKTSADALYQMYAAYYDNEPFVNVIPHSNVESALEGGFLSPVACNGTNRCDLFVFGHETQLMVSARFDNLGKGASGAAVQNMNIMLGLPETAGL